MTHQQTLRHLQSQYQHLSDSYDRWAAFSTDPAFARLLRRQAGLYRQLADELTSTRPAGKAATDRVAALYLQRDDVLVAGACYRAIKPLMGHYQALLANTTLPGHLQPVVSRHYALLDQGAALLKRMMTV